VKKKRRRGKKRPGEQACRSGLHGGKGNDRVRDEGISKSQREFAI